MIIDSVIAGEDNLSRITLAAHSIFLNSEQYICKQSGLAVVGME